MQTISLIIYIRRLLIFLAVLAAATTCSMKTPATKGYDPELLSLASPEKFSVQFETTKGNFIIIAERKFSPLAVDRFYQLIKCNYFTDIPIYRAVPNFVIQFGTLDTVLDNAWSKHILVDEPVLKSNETGTISFARAGVNSRGTQLFINLKNNVRLDTVTYGGVNGFPAFGIVSSGMEVINSVFTGYNDEPRIKLNSFEGNINEMLKSEFPNLDYIKRAYIVGE